MNNKLINQEKKGKVNSILKRFKNPLVITSIISQILIILTIMNIKVDTDAVTNVIVAFCSILVSLGIMNNPVKGKEIEKNNGNYSKKSLKIKCPNCGTTTEYLMVDCELMSDDEGNLYGISFNDMKNKNTGEKCTCKK
ncbi:MAG: hypothetical protein RR844_06980 [Clostridium sp.]